MEAAPMAQVPTFEARINGKIVRIEADGWRQEGDETVFFQLSVNTKTGERQKVVGRYRIEEPHRNVVRVWP
jgi:hypothetical protein